MNKKLIKIDRDKCIGCGLCVTVCQEGAIDIENGKAKLLREDYCDGLGNCLPVCPTKAITFEVDTLACGCPSTHSKTFERNVNEVVNVDARTFIETCLRQWPIQIKLVPINAPYLQNAKILVTADCCAYAYGNFHNEFMKNKMTLIGCPKLDEGDYSEKLTSILKTNDVKSITVTRMEVPCCAGIEQAVRIALQNCGKLIQWNVVTISTDGKVIDN